MMDFSADGYRKMLLAFRESGYSFLTFEDVINMDSVDGPYILLRHDIDVDLGYALDLARIEHEQGVQSTYFISLRSPFYNLLSPPSSLTVLHIHQLGHELGVHVDLAPYGSDHARGISDAEILTSFYPHINTSLTSIHHPGELSDLERLMNLAPIKNVYGRVASGEVAYITDSTGRWGYGHPLDSDAFRDKKPIQILTHPIWWMQEGGSPMLKLTACLEHRQAASLEHAKDYLPTLFKLEGSGE